MMRWPPSERQWAEITKDLPATADRVRFRRMVEAVVQIFADERGAEMAKQLRVIAKLADSKNVRKLFAAIDQLPGWPQSFATQFIRAWRMSVADVIDLAEITAAHGENWNKHRPERLYESLLLACTKYGDLRLSVSKEGRLNRTMERILKLALPESLGSEAIKTAIKRERDRRALGTRVPR
jgi:hypothetical protein